MKSRELLLETMDELTLKESRDINGGNSLVNLGQSIFTTALQEFGKTAGTMGNCVALAKDYFKPVPPATPTIGVGCTKR